MTCETCKIDFEDDDIVWADNEGNLTMSGMPYCTYCLPEQPNYGEEDAGYELGLGLE